MEHEEQYTCSDMGKIWSYTRGCVYFTNAPYIRDTHTIGIVLDEDDKEKLKFLNDALLTSKSSGKGICHMDPLFCDREGEEH